LAGGRICTPSAIRPKARRFLPDTIHANCLFTLRHAACSPLVQIDSLKAEPLGANLYKVTAVIGNHGFPAVIGNHGFLPTNMTTRALKFGTAGSVKSAVELTTDQELLMGEQTQDLGHLAGRDERVATWSPWMPDWHQTKAKAEWLVRGQPGSTLTVNVGAQRAGSKTATITLPA